VEVDAVQGDQGAVQEGAATQGGLAVAAVACADGAVEGDRVGPFGRGPVVQLPPARVGAERARYCEYAVTISPGRALDGRATAKQALS